MNGKKLVGIGLAAAMTGSLLAGCGSTTSDSATSTSADTASAETATSSATASDTAASDGQASSGDRETVNFWYLWGGDEAGYIEQIIQAYNESQDKYEVVGLSTPDQQKVITGISGGDGPDITDDFGSSIPNYAEQNIAMALDDYIAKDGIDVNSTFISGSMDQQTYNGKVYALPISANVNALYYNKDLLSAAGYDNPPATMEELQEMASKLTTAENGTITQFGAPLIPTSYWWENFVFANGDTFGEPGALKADNEGFVKALTWLQNYVSEFGSDTVNSYVTSGQSKINSAQDPFLAGEQALRIDGPWFYKMAKDAGVNFGLVLTPSYEAQGDKTYSLLDTSNFYIPSTAKNPDGAWDFLKYITMGDGAKMFITLKGDLPALQSLLDDPDVSGASESYDVYLKVLSDSTLVTMPNILDSTSFDTALQTAIDTVMLGGDAKEAVKEAQDTVSSIE
jgi:multiple sugar transport system substrate-binding protein